MKSFKRETIIEKTDTILKNKKWKNKYKNLWNKTNKKFDKKLPIDSIKKNKKKNEFSTINNGNDNIYSNNSLFNNSWTRSHKDKKIFKFNINLSDKKNKKIEQKSLNDNNIFKKINFEIKNWIYDNKVKDTSIDFNKNIENSSNSNLDKVSNYNFVFKLKNDNDTISNNSKISNFSKLSSPLKMQMNYFNDNHLENVKNKILNLKKSNEELVDKFNLEYKSTKNDIEEKICENFINKLNKVWKSYLKEQKINLKIKKKELSPIQNKFINLLKANINIILVKYYTQLIDSMSYKFFNQSSKFNLNNPSISFNYETFIALKNKNEKLKDNYYKAYENDMIEIKNQNFKFQKLINKNIKQNKRELFYKLCENSNLVAKILNKGKTYLKEKNFKLNDLKKKTYKINDLKNNINKLENQLNYYLKIN